MVTLVIESDERELNALMGLLGKMPELTEASPFSRPEDALRWARENTFDLAILSVRTDSAALFALARELRAIAPACGLIFCAASGQYAVEAFALHADGYLLRPLQAERLRAEIDYLCRKAERGEKKKHDKLLTIRCCGGFEVYDRNGEPVSFRRSRSRELLALLVDRRGMSITSKEICAIFWEDDGEQDRKNMAHLWQLFSELNRALRQAGAEGVVRRSGANHFVDMALLDCPDLEQGRKNRDELCYMVGYSWADTADD